jgi:hypothetical protein
MSWRLAKRNGLGRSNRALERAGWLLAKTTPNQMQIRDQPSDATASPAKFATLGQADLLARQAQQFLEP